MIPKITITQRLVDKYPFARFIGFTATNLKNKKSSAELEKEKRKVENYIKKNIAKYKEEIERKIVFFKKYKKSFPIGYQLQTISKGKKIPKDSVLKDLFFMTELKNCLIMSVQDSSKLGKELVYDISPGDEDFVYSFGEDGIEGTDDDTADKQFEFHSEEFLWGPTFGFGLKMKSFTNLDISVDYAYRTAEIFNDTQWIAISFGF